jgi:hypothetical protein
MKKLMVLVCLGAASLFGQVSIGIRIGPPPAPRVIRVRPVAPGPAYDWIDGYWYADGRRWKWHAGYWTLPPYAGARWVGPRHDGERFYAGYWEGDRGRFDHDHHWDRDRNRDFRDRRDRDHDHH